MTASGIVVLVRHGETEWSRSGRHTSRTDLPLTGAGRRQAEDLGQCLSEWRFALVLTSPLQRAAETCRLAGFGGRAQVRDDLREWDYGDYEGRTTADIRIQRAGWTLWSDGVPNGETLDQVATRADRIVTEVQSVDGNVAVFGHGHMLRVIAARWVGLEASGGSRLGLDAGTVSALGYEREVSVILRWNQPCSTSTSPPPGSPPPR